MAKLYISEETIKKLSDSNNSQDYANILKAFDANRPEPEKQRHILKASNANQPGIKRQKPTKDNLQKSFKKLRKTLRRIRQRYQIEPQQPKSTKAKSRQSRLVTAPPIRKKHIKSKKAKQLIITIKESTANRQYDKPATFYYSPSHNKHHSISSQNNQISHASTNNDYLLDHHDTAGEYKSRQVEFGHGRTKSKEWNDEIARKFQKELKTSTKKTDWTDRFALK